MKEIMTMVNRDALRLPLLLLMAALIVAGCSEGEADTRELTGDTVKVEEDVSTVDYDYDYEPVETPVTLPVVSTFLADSAFSRSVRDELQLTDAELDSLMNLSNRSVQEMYARYNNESAQSRDPYSARQGGETADREIRRILGDDRGGRMMDLMRMRWRSDRGMAMGGGDSSTVSSDTAMMGSGERGERTRRSAENPAAIPDDTRLLVNIPDFRMDLYVDGELRGSWPIAIGYPEFPLPTGLRHAKTAIFNPTWTPPNESWVRASSSVEPYKTIPGGDPNNPLGIIKIPIGLPSLIHSGKSQSVIGTFGSHGCIGLTDSQMREFVKVLADATGANINDSVIAHYKKNRSTTKNIPLGGGIPVEIRYETMRVVDGKLEIYRDVYDYNTNTEELLTKTLATYGVSMSSLADTKKKEILDGLRQMALDAQGQSDKEDTQGGDTATSSQEKTEMTRSISGKKKLVFEIPGLNAEGYPARFDGSAEKKNATAATGKKGEDTTDAG